MAPMESLIGPNQDDFLRSSSADARVEMVLALLRVGRLVDARRGALLRPSGLSEGRLGALLTIQREQGISPARLSDQLGVTRATVTGLLDGLEREGNIERRPDPTDRRGQTLHPTSRGAASIQQGVALVNDFLSEITDQVDEADVAVTLRTLSVLWEALNHDEEDR